MTASNHINLPGVKPHAANLISKTFDVNWRAGVKQTAVLPQGFVRIQNTTRESFFGCLCAACGIPAKLNG
jgi:hypothetical protein